MKMAAAMMLAGAMGALAQPTTVLLWEKGAPDALGTADKDKPTLTVYLPEAGKANGSAIVICPGGGYGGLANHEGEHYARFLNEQGIALNRMSTISYGKVVPVESNKTAKGRAANRRVEIIVLK